MKNIKALSGIILYAATIVLLVVACNLGSDIEAFRPPVIVPPEVTQQFHTVTFCINGANGQIPTARTVEAGFNVQLPGFDCYDFSKDDYVFYRWSTAPDGNGNIFLPGSTYTPSADRTFYAKWVNENDVFVITFKDYDGSIIGDKNVMRNTAATAPPPPNRSGLTFSGWFRNEELTIPYNFASLVVGDITLYAKWVCTVTFNSNGGSIVPNQIVEIGGTVEIPDYPTRSGHIFEGWYSDAGLTNKWNFQTGTVNNNITLHAKWTIANGHVINFRTNGGTAIPPQILQTGEPIGRPDPDPTRVGYTFRNWFTNEQHNVLFPFGTLAARDLTIHAGWTPITYTVVYDGNGATSGNTATSSHTYDVEGKLRENGFVRDGFVFWGWNTEKDGSGKGYTDEEAVINLRSTAGDFTLYAQWAIYYSITANNTPSTLSLIFTFSQNPGQITRADINIANGCTQGQYTVSRVCRDRRRTDLRATVDEQHGVINQGSKCIFNKRND